jgi:CheY-like chemotaxis protein
MNGIEAVKHIQDLVNENKIDSEYLNVVFISANIDQKDSLQDIQKKYPIVKGFLTKPVKITKIQDMIKRFYYD